MQVELEQDAFGLTFTEPGRLMAHHYIRLKTMAAIMGMPSHAAMPDLLNVVARSAECSSIKLRRGEKKLLNSLNKQLGQECLEHCIVDEHRSDRPKERIGTGPEKVFVMVRSRTFAVA